MKLKESYKMRHAKTLRKLPPTTRKIAKFLNDQERALKRLNSTIPDLALLENECIAWHIRQDHYKAKGEVDPLSLDFVQGGILSKATKRG